MADEFRWPTLAELPRAPSRVIAHWSGGDSDIPNGGSYHATDHERLSYHALIEHEEGESPEPDDDRILVLPGVPVERNLRILSGVPRAIHDPERGYAGHAGGWNTNSIGLALCGMRGAVDRRPGGGVDPGPQPITRPQVFVLVTELHKACVIYGRDPTPEWIMTHYEAENSRQGGVQSPLRRWDITWIPGLALERDEVGDWIRRQVGNLAAGRPVEL